MNTIIGKKVQQLQGFLEDGTRVPVTVIAASDNPVMGIKTLEKDTYMAVQLGFGKKKHPTKALLGTMKKANVTEAPRKLMEVRLTDTPTLQVGDMVKVDEVFSIGDIVDVTGQSKGKGFAGGVKRHHFKGGPRTHGQSDRERAPGSIGQTTTPGRVYKGKRMAGNMGDEQVTIQNLVVLGVDGIEKKLLIKGLVPGILGGVVWITKRGEVKEKKFVPLFSVAEPVVEEPVVETATPVEETTSEASEPVVGTPGTVAPIEDSPAVTEAPSEEQTETPKEAK